MQKKEIIFAEERKNRILQLLNENSKLLVPDLCEYFKVSPATIRNDLRELEGNGLLKRTHGGALSNHKARYEPDAYEKEVSMLNEKRAIARFAVDLVEDGDTIAIDTGTTTLEFAKLLSDKKGITVVTNDVDIARLLEQNSDANIIVIGGTLRRNFHCTVGPIAVRLIDELSVDKVFVGANGITLEKGLTTPDINQAEVKKAMIQISDEVVVLCDSSKFGNRAFAQVAPVTAVHRVITDNKIDERDLKSFQSQGIQIDVVNA